MSKLTWRNAFDSVDIHYYEKQSDNVFHLIGYTELFAKEYIAHVWQGAGTGFVEKWFSSLPDAQIFVEEQYQLYILKNL